MSQPKASPVVRVLAWIVTLPFLVVGVGLIFHTAFEPDLFGKYTLGYFAFLCFWWLLLTPGVYLFARFLFRTHRLDLPSGRVLHVRPSFKILVTLVFGSALVLLVRFGIQQALGEGVTTPHGTDVFHPYLQNTPEPGQRDLQINLWGFRGHDIEPGKTPDTYRIFAFGGSTVFSGPLPLEATWPEVLRDRLAARHPDVTVEVQNAAGEWHCSQHSLIKLLTMVQEFDPDLLIIYHGINDLGRTLTPDLFGTGVFRYDYRHFLGPVANLARPSETTLPFVRMRLGYWFSDFLAHKVRMAGPEGDGVHGLDLIFFPRAQEVEVERWYSLPTFRRNMRDFVRIARDKGYDVILASQPTLYRPDLTPDERTRLWTSISHQWDGKRASLASLTDGMRRFNEATKELAATEDVPFVDLDAKVPKTLDYMWDDCHYTAKACALIAQVLDEHIDAEGMVESRMDER